MHRHQFSAAQEPPSAVPTLVGEDSWVHVDYELVCTEVDDEWVLVDLSFSFTTDLAVSSVLTGGDAVKLGAVGNTALALLGKRSRTNNKGKSKGDREEEIRQWHVGVYKLLQGEKAAESVQLDEKWGRFTPAQRINVDQSPLGFISGLQDTYAEKGSHEVWISTPSGSSLEKRQCTLQVCYAADVASGKIQCRLALIFRGEGKRITELERLSWDARVDVYFQTNAWADREFCLAWLERTYGPWAKPLIGTSCY
ncbi:hypothetical protein CYMTET_41881 [Cymbomonas tetramitiformis]|uniref:Uncharacterized protein n=1 Tax=Cymbomonas tetramitiformis TaxID=36881 RepID=A0AAE0C573_9CHLO|nr:hypothetical protein CYMTET_41881 [Cymbomonas tetramitiformis]